MNFCTKCGNQLKPDARFCSKCGDVIKTTSPKASPDPAGDQVCRVCGVKSNPGMKFCISCGSLLTALPPPPAFSKPPPISQPNGSQTPPPVPPAYQQSPPQPPIGVKPVRKKSRVFLKIAISVLILFSVIVPILYFFGSYDPALEESITVQGEEEKYDPVKIDSAAEVVETVFAASDTAGLANILSPSSLEQRRQYFAELIPHMPAFANDFKTRKLLYATARFAVYEFGTTEEKFTAEFCLGDKGQWLLMSF